LTMNDLTLLGPEPRPNKDSQAPTVLVPYTRGTQ